VEIAEPLMHAQAPPAPAAPAEARRDAKLEVVRAALDPMVGRPAGTAHLLVYRTVLVGAGSQGRQGYRQGLVLDRAKLGAWLSARALGPTGLSEVADLAFDPEGGHDASAFVFQHRFAEPFDALTARLTLAPLPGVGQPGAIYALVALLALVGAAGLLAVERMVAVAVHFAERRSNFVSAVTHELKTPLTAIRMYAEMLRDGLVSSEAKRGEYYGTITDESERLSRLIDNVLEFSRLSRGAREMDLRVGAVGPVLQEAADKLRAHAAREGFALEVAVDPGLPPVRYDRDALLQVLFNLVDNAMKYARQAPARRVLLEARRSGPGVEVSVRDFGPGVPARHLSRVFEPFYRGEDELTRTTRGTGIGLALVRELSLRMGAAVRGANAEGGGFRVCLAFRAEPA
jgi:signal transduction histidine kinase